MNKLAICLFLGALLALTTVAAAPVVDTIKEGSGKYYNIQDTGYEVELLLVDNSDPLTAVFIINGMVTPSLKLYDTYTLGGVT